ncbi:MAG: hypothetical protein HOP07_17550 [Bacteriovoracaceae bacterium]|nr:hypothetical protein [Bacteriovoracaceae bacterium]
MGRQANKLKVEECNEIILSEFSKFKEKDQFLKYLSRIFLMSSFCGLCPKITISFTI